ncbi:MAG: alpha/beta hydrolase [Anaerolineae bacterium]|nr:alpha/beta hydrolase [Anaerolineae bacterium]
MPQSLYEYGGSGSIIHLAVANGFPPETYTPLIAPFTSEYRVISLPPRALWSEPPASESTRSWRDLAEDLLAGLRSHGIDRVIAVGHSFGAVASLVAAAQEPARFRALIMLDPTIFMPGQLTILRMMQIFGLQSRMPLVQSALKRRRHFENVEAAFDYWRKRRLFSDWPETTLRLYAESMTRPAPHGNGVELTWSPAWESRYYETVLTTTWRYVRQVRGKLPILLIRGGSSNTLSRSVATRLQQQLPEMSYAEVSGHGHLFPHTAPDETRRLISAWLPETEDRER